jgi:alkylated DNA repair dioxygenase AlkB
MFYIEPHITGYTLHKAALNLETYCEVWDFLNGLTYTRIERPAMHLWRSLQDDNTHNPQAHHLIGLLKGAELEAFISFDDVSVVRYDSGSDYVDWHSDGGPLLQPGCAMGVLSFGVARRIEFRRKGEEEAGASVVLNANDLIVSREGFQDIYQHRIPPCDVDGLRYSIVLFTHNKQKKNGKNKQTEIY